VSVRKQEATRAIRSVNRSTLTQNLMQVHEPNFYGIKNGSVLSDDDISTLIAEGATQQGLP